MKKLLYIAIVTIIAASGFLASCTEEVNPNSDGNTPPTRSDKQWD